jgi:AraC-like DNA-binding protein
MFASREARAILYSRASAGTLLDASGKGAAWEQVGGKPPVSIRDLIPCYRGYAEALSRPIRRLQVPCARVMLVVGFGEDLRIYPVGLASDSKAYQAFVVGLEAEPLISEHVGVRRCIEIPLQPWVAHRLFQGAAAEFAKETVALEDLWGQDAVRLVDQLSHLSSWKSQFARIDQLLAQKIKASNYQTRPEIRWAWRQLEFWGGGLPIRQLAKAIGWSDRHFARCFRESIGTTPKAAARQIRFTQAHQLLTAPQNYPLSEIALTCGYSDQSHLTREVRAFSGCSPATLQNACFADPLDIPGTLV